MRIAQLIRRFTRQTRGTALVEFALVLPVMVIFTGCAIEFGRVVWSYQAAVSGLRDAARYVARITPVDICTHKADFVNYTGDLKRIIGTSGRRSTDQTSGVFAGYVTLKDVKAELDCVTSTQSGVWNFRVSPAPVATVRAQIEIQLPMAKAIAFGTGSPALGTINAWLTEKHRVYGT